MGPRQIEGEQHFQSLVAELPGDAGQHAEADDEHRADARGGSVEGGLETQAFDDRQFPDEEAGTEQQAQGQQGCCRNAGAQGFKRGVAADGDDVQVTDDGIPPYVV